jgi:polar amino acid transport system substrate-binding protein
MRNIKKLALLLIVLISTSSFAADLNLWKNSTLNKIIERGELRVAMEPGYQPFEMTDKKGRLIGYDVDMAKKMAKEMGVKLKMIPTAWDGIIGGLLSDKYDIIMGGMTITQTRNLKVNFADSDITIGQTVMISNKLAKTITNAKQLDQAQYTIVTKTGTTGEIAAKKFFTKAKLLTFDDSSTAGAEVLAGRADAMIYDQPFIGIFVGTKGAGQLTHLDTPLTYEPLAWAIRKGDPDFLNWLNNFLRQIKNDKVEDFYGKTYHKWFVKTDWLKRLK